MVRAFGPPRSKLLFSGFIFQVPLTLGRCCAAADQESVISASTRINVVLWPLMASLLRLESAGVLYHKPPEEQKVGLLDKAVGRMLNHRQLH